MLRINARVNKATAGDSAGGSDVILGDKVIIGQLAIRGTKEEAECMCTKRRVSAAGS